LAILGRECDYAGQGRQDAGQQLEQRGFAGTVAAQQRGEAAARERQANIAQDDVLVIAGRHAVQRHDGVWIQGFSAAAIWVTL
jgi:hypothetical protein